jgi:hypothetical protein
MLSHVTRSPAMTTEAEGVSHLPGPVTTKREAISREGAAFSKFRDRVAVGSRLGPLGTSLSHSWAQRTSPGWWTMSVE